MLVTRHDHVLVHEFRRGACRLPMREWNINNVTMCSLPLGFLSRLDPGPFRPEFVTTALLPCAAGCFSCSVCDVELDPFLTIGPVTLQNFDISSCPCCFGAPASVGPPRDGALPIREWRSLRELARVENAILSARAVVLDEQ
jgi:hypothetical protein